MSVNPNSVRHFSCETPEVLDLSLERFCPMAGSLACGFISWDTTKSNRIVLEKGRTIRVIPTPPAYTHVIHACFLGPHAVLALKHPEEEKGAIQFLDTDSFSGSIREMDSNLELFAVGDEHIATHEKNAIVVLHAPDLSVAKTIPVENDAGLSRLAMGGNSIALYFSTTQEVKIWNHDSGEQVYTIDNFTCDKIAVFNHHLAMCCFDDQSNRIVYVYDCRQNAAIFSRRLSSICRYTRMTRDHLHIADEYDAVCLNLQTGELVGSLGLDTRHGERVFDMRFAAPPSSANEVLTVLTNQGRQRATE